MSGQTPAQYGEGIGTRFFKFRRGGDRGSVTFGFRAGTHQAEEAPRAGSRSSNTSSDLLKRIVCA